jgi:outer membrane protein assembly factor BamB
VTASDDCIQVVWGSEDQFEAQLFTLVDVSKQKVDWPSKKAWPLVVGFEIPENATRASLVFDQHSVPIKLEGERNPPGPAPEPLPAPIPQPSTQKPPGTEGYFLDHEYGLAILDISREQSSRLTEWVQVEIGFSIITIRDEDVLDPTIVIDSKSGHACFGATKGHECIRVFWGDGREYEAFVTLSEDDSAVPWPRKKGWPISLTFEVPEDYTEGTLAFGEHNIPVDLNGMHGNTPSWSYKGHYPSISEGVRLYDSQGKTLTLESIIHDSEFGGIELVVSATNGDEATDFAPKLDIRAARVSETGVIFDDGGILGMGWQPGTITIEGMNLAPGQNGEAQAELPRIWQEGFKVLHYDVDRRPDALLLQFTVSDQGVEASPTEVVTGYVPFERLEYEKMYWDNLSGTLVWRYDAGEVVNTPPVISDGVALAVSSDGYLHALDIANGQLLWHFETGGMTTPVAANQVVYVGSSSGNLHALDLLTGRQLWEYDSEGSLYLAPTVPMQIVYMGSSNGRVFALDIWEYETGGGIEAAPAVAGDTVYVASSNKLLYALDADSGILRWQYLTQSSQLHSPTVHDDMVFVGSSNYLLYAIYAKTGALRWWRTMNVDIVHSPTAAGQVIYTTPGGRLCALEVNSGEDMWCYDAAVQFVSPPTVNEGTLYAGSSDGNLYVLDADMGELLWQYQTGGIVSSSSQIPDSIVCIGSWDHHVYALMASPPR